MSSPNIKVLVGMLTQLAMMSEPHPEREFLFDRGWVPLGRNSTTGLEGWGKVIDGRAVMVDQPEALEIERRDEGAL